MKNNNGSTGTLFPMLIVIILLFIFNSAITFGLGYFGGWLAKITIGSKLIEGLNLLFNTDYFDKNMLPMIGGTLSWIGNFFKAYNFNSKKD